MEISALKSVGHALQIAKETLFCFQVEVQIFDIDSFLKRLFLLIILRTDISLINKFEFKIAPSLIYRRDLAEFNVVTSMLYLQNWKRNKDV